MTALPAPQAIWIVDTSPFVGLAKIGHLGLLAGPSRQVWVADVVEQEVLAGPHDDAAKDALRRGWNAFAQTGFVRVAAPPPPPPLAALGLDAGEESVISLALQSPRGQLVGMAGRVTIIDDGAGRAAAKALGVAVVGTVGVMIQAQAEGRIAKVAPLLHDLQTAGLFLPREGILTALLAALGEPWP